MKYVASLSFVALVCVVASLAWADHHEGDSQSSQWFDMENCAFCKKIAAEPEMMAASKWEVHPIENGMLMAMVVTDEHKAKWDKVSKEMQNVRNQISAGEKPELCNFCHEFENLIEEGAKLQEIETSFGNITLVTSDKEELVSKIKQHAKKTKQEHEKMMAKERNL